MAMATSPPGCIWDHPETWGPVELEHKLRFVRVISELQYSSCGPLVVAENSSQTHCSSPCHDGQHTLWQSIQKHIFSTQRRSNVEGLAVGMLVVGRLNLEDGLILLASAVNVGPQAWSE